MAGERIPVTTRKGRAQIQERLSHFDRLERFAVLATDNEGHPYTSLVAFALTPDLKQLVFATPKATRKYRNIVKGKHVALLLDNRAGDKKDVMSAEAITIVGMARPLRKGAHRDGMAALFLEKHPDLTVFVGSPTTALICVDIQECVHVGRFQTVTVWETKYHQEE
jgi:general stress protein 26